jgi:hypothetical protein
MPDKTLIAVMAAILYRHDRDYAATVRVAKELYAEAENQCPEPEPEPQPIPETVSTAFLQTVDAPGTDSGVDPQATTEINDDAITSLAEHQL